MDLRILLLLLSSMQVTIASMQDLTHYYDEHLIRWPGHKQWVYNLNRAPFESRSNKTLWLESNDFSTAEHMGTHIDAPAHLMKGMHRLDQVPLSDLIVPMVVIDVRKQAAETQDYAMTIEDVLEHEKEHGQIPEGAAVFMYSGWDEFWFKHDKLRYLGGEGMWDLHHPGFHPDTAEWLMQNRNIKGIGIDCVSFDVGASKDFEVHTTLFAQNVWGVENLCNLGKAPATGATVHVMPLNIWQASGAPSRVVAFWGEGQSGHFYSAATTTQWTVLTLLMSTLMAFQFVKK